MMIFGNRIFLRKQNNNKAIALKKQLEQTKDSITIKKNKKRILSYNILLKLHKSF